MSIFIHRILEEGDPPVYSFGDPPVDILHAFGLDFDTLQLGNR
jgi:hypothetical protein